MVMAEIIERAGGIPLFVEEMMIAVQRQRARRSPAHGCCSFLPDFGGSGKPAHASLKRTKTDVHRPLQIDAFAP
jgi:hypothetical protein